MIYKMWGNISTSDSVATVDIQDDGIIYGVLFSICPTGLDALSDSMACEVSFMSSNTFNVNDTRGSIAMSCFTQNFLTSGGSIAGGNGSISGLLIPVDAGERIHLHSLVSSGGGGTMNVYVYVDDGASIDKLRPKRRRR